MTALNHVSVCAHDLEASVRFYKELFGFERLPTPNFGFPVQWLGGGGTQLHVFERPEAAPTYHHFGLTVDDPEPIYARAKELGCFDDRAFANHLVELPGDQVQIYLRDPAGNLVEVDAAGASRLPEWMRAELVALADQEPQDEENLRARLAL